MKSWTGIWDNISSNCAGEGKILLVGGMGDPGYWLPGGGIESGEAPEGALARELREEAAATIFELKQFGAQRVDDYLGTTEYHAFFWSRVALADEYAPKHEVSKRKLVKPEDFLDTLIWGRDDPKASMLLERALQFNRFVWRVKWRRILPTAVRPQAEGDD